MKARLRALIEEALRRAVAEGELPEGEFPSVALEYPPEERFGDYATNLALVLAPRFKLPPREVATRLLKHFEGDDILAKVEVAGPGFVNFFLKDEVWFEALREACLRGEGYGKCEVGKGKRVLVEFVSANPTGPLHIGHGRIAAFGDTLSRVLELAGWRVEREYYINDVGTQMELLGRSVYARYRELLGEESTFPEDGYRGDYIFEIARVLIERHGRGLLERPEEEAVKVAASEAEGLIMSWIREDLERFRVTFDHYFRESSLYEGGEVQRVLDELRVRGLLYERDGALWFKSSAFGDEKDRVVVKASGATTYFASDIAYHANKLRRGYEVLVDIWGADHHGYVKRVEAALEAMGYERDRLKVILVQLVNLMRGGERLSMSTRAGEFTPLRDVMDEVGVDACRFFFLLRRAESPLDFDLELAKRQGEENPVYYVQYVHARISSIFKKAEERGVEMPDIGEVDLTPLKLPEERGIAKQVGLFPEVVESMALSLEPHRLPPYLLGLARAFHSYYNKHRVLSEDRELTSARLVLVQAVRQVVRKGLEILGISAPEEM